ncbi:MAG: zinc finger protein [Firmicutes bacterium]|nr:zinc finger protein [Bacillota bacterium]
MTVAELEQKVDFLALIRKDYEPAEFGNLYTVEPCPVCGNFGHFLVNPETKSYGSLEGCCEGGGAYAYLQEVKGYSPSEAYDKLRELASAGEAAAEKGKLALEIDAALIEALESYKNDAGIDINEFLEELLRKALPEIYFMKR